MSAVPRIKLGLVTATLRLALGFYFFTGGLCTMVLLTGPFHFATLQAFTATNGVVNGFVDTFIFDWLTPQWFFLIAATVSFLIGLNLLLGLYTKYTCIAGIIALMLQCFALPVTTVPNLYFAIDVYTLPASLVLAPQIGLIGFLCCQYSLGAGPKSLDYRMQKLSKPCNRYFASRALFAGALYPLLIGALFGWYNDITNFGVTPVLLLVIVVLLLLPGNMSRRLAGASLALTSIWYLSGLIQPEMNFWQAILAIRIAVVYFFVGLILTHFCLIPRTTT